MKFTLLASTFAASMVVTTIPSFAQVPTPAMLNVTRYEVRSDRIAEFEEVEKQIADSFKKAAPSGQFRNIYRNVVGNTAEYWVITPLSKFAERDGESPSAKITTEPEIAARVFVDLHDRDGTSVGRINGARLAPYLESTRTSIDRTFSDLNATSPGMSYPPPYVRYIRVRVRPGTTEQLIANVKTDVLPALKKMNGVTLRVRQTVIGGNVNEFTIAAGFEKWAELDDTTALPTAMGAETFRKFEEKMQAIETNVEEYVLAYQKDLSYDPGLTPTTTSR
jgi:hypothetical protein